MADIIYRVQNDTGPDAEFVVTRKVVDPDTGAETYEIVDLSAASVRFVIKSKKTGAVTNSDHDDCIITDGAAGKCKYVFQSGDLPTAGGKYRCDLEFTVAGKVETYYKEIEIRTRKEIAT